MPHAAVVPLMARGAPIGLIFFDRSHKCVRVNAFCEQLLKPAGASKVGRRLDDLLPGLSPDLLPAVESVFSEGISTMDLEVVSSPGSEKERSWLTGIFPVRQHDPPPRRPRAGLSAGRQCGRSA